MQAEYLKQMQLVEETKELTKRVFHPEHMQMCIKNGIKIYYHAISNYEGRIAIDYKGHLEIGSRVYKNQGQKFGKNDELWWKVVESLYTEEFMKLGLECVGRQEQIIDLEVTLIKTK
jgi:hypothetical protein